MSAPTVIRTISDAHSEQAWFGLRREVIDLPVVARFTVRGEPVSKARPRLANGRTYTPEKTVAAEAEMALRFRLAAPGWEPKDDRSFGVIALFFAATRQRRDVDNMTKLILDGLNEVAWKDDDQVIEISARKGYVANKAEARTEVLIYEMPDRKPTLGTITCGHCEEAFDRRAPGDRRKFCSTACANKAKTTRAVKTCGADGCDKPAGKGRAYCCDECRTATTTITRTCLHCGTTFARFRSWATNGSALCSPTCRADYWRKHRAIAARGVCEQCGGTTSKKTYHRCRACVIAGRRSEPSLEIGGTHVVVTLTERTA